MVGELAGPQGATLHEVTAESPLLDIACNLFEELFPEDHRYAPYIRACARGRYPSHPKTLDHVWLVQQEGQWVGVRVFSYIITRDFGHGAYIGLLNKMRNHGVGDWLVRQTLNQLDLDARQFGRSGASGYLVEVERPVDAEDESDRLHREQRLRFHRKCGAIILPVPYMEPVMIAGVDYISPTDLQGESPRPMHLVFVPSPMGRQIANLNLVDFIHGLYLDVYRLPASHEFVRNSLSYLIGDQP